MCRIAGPGVDFANVKVNMKNRKYPKSGLLKETAKTLKESVVSASVSVSVLF